jgi:hypothetical protein
MSIGGRWELAAITVEDLVAEAAAWRRDPRASRAVVLSTAEQLRTALSLLDSESPVAQLVAARTEAFLGGHESG